MSPHFRRIRLVGLVAIVTLAVACGGGGGGGGGSGDAGNGNGNGNGDTSTQVAPDMSNVPVSMSEAERDAAILRVNAAFDAVKTGDWNADNTVLLTLIKSDAAFADAGISPDQSVWARFQDGLAMAWLADFGNAGSASTLTAKSSAPSVAPLSTGNVPGGDKAVLIDAKNLSHGGQAAVTPWLTKAGYNATQYGPQVSVIDLAGIVNNASVLYISTHGGFGATKSGMRTYQLASTDTYDPTSPDSDPATHKAMWESDLIVKLVLNAESTNPNVPTEYLWGITDKFVKAYWTLAPDSLVIVDACSLMETSSQERAFIGVSFLRALNSVSANIKTNVLSWNGNIEVVYSAEPIKKFLARVLGDNSVDNASPPRRPFRYQQVYSWMSSTGENVVASGTTLNLATSSNNADDGQLVPSIKRANVIRAAKGGSWPHAGDWYLELMGSFGPDPGADYRSVTVGGTELEVYADGWKEELIQAKLPQNLGSAGAYGDVVVEVRGHKSNVLPLTQWTGTIAQTQILLNTDGQGKVEITCPVRVTGDVHFFRDSPTTDPKVSFANPTEVPGACTFKMSGDWGSAGDHYYLSGSGSYIAQPTDEPLLGSFSSASVHGNPNAGNTGSGPVYVYATVFANANGTAKGSLRHVTSSGETTEDVDVGLNPVGAYWNNKTLKLDNTYSVNGQTMDCNYASMFVDCKETWTLTPRGPIPNADTQG